MEHLPKVTRQALLLSGLSQVVARSEPADRNHLAPIYFARLGPLTCPSATNFTLRNFSPNFELERLGPYLVSCVRAWIPSPELPERLRSKRGVGGVLCLGEGMSSSSTHFLVFFTLCILHMLSHAATYHIPCRDGLNKFSHLLSLASSNYAATSAIQKKVNVIFCS